jgi:hypothetical protein
VHDQLTNTMTGPDFLEAYADQQLAIGNEINAAEFRRRAREWHNDVATRDHCEGCYPGLVQDHARAVARIAELEAQIAAANAALRPAA